MFVALEAGTGQQTNETKQSGTKNCAVRFNFENSLRFQSQDVLFLDKRENDRSLWQLFEHTRTTLGAKTRPGVLKGQEITVKTRTICTLESRKYEY